MSRKERTGAEPAGKGRVERRQARERRIGIERAIAELASVQYGVVGRRQLRALGLADHTIDQRIAGGRLHRVYRGAYAVGHPRIDREGRWLAATLSVGGGAVLSHRSAAALWGFAEPDDGVVSVTASGWRRDRDGLRLHCGRLEPDEVTSERGILVTTVARTVLDVATAGDSRALRRAVHEAEVRGLWSQAAIEETLDRHRGRAGTRALWRLLGDARLGADRTRSELELAFLERVVEARLPSPRANLAVRVGGSELELDFAWPDRRVAVELDGHATHSTRAKFERDRERDRLLQANGWRPVRVTWRQLAAEWPSVLRDLRRLLSDRSDVVD